MTLRKILMWSLATLVVASAGAQNPHWVGTWACAPLKQPASDKTPRANTTVRDVVHLSLGGQRIRLRLSNTFGTTPLTVGSTHVAMSAGDGKTLAGTDHAVTFGGLETVTIPPGAVAVSDPMAMPLKALSDLAVSAFMPEQTLPLLTYHAQGSSWTYHGAGNQAAAVQMDKASRENSWMLLTGVEVDAAPGASAVVTIGDSITDGAHSTPNKNTRWPDVLAARLQGNPATAGVGVMNAGISGNRVLHDQAGTGALARLDRDVLAQVGVKYVIVLESINDIRYATNPRTPEDVVTAQQLIWGLGQIALRAHERGLKVFGATLTPFTGSRNATPEGEAMRQEINQWIRTGGAFDAVLDFDLATRDPAHPEMFWPANDSGDHLHPGDTGYKKMGDSIDLKLFQ